MIMNRLSSTIVFLFVFASSWAQPEPFPIDRSFTPELSFLQKQWTGEYNGVDPMSQARLSISRILCLYEDMTFTNVSSGVIASNNGVSDVMILKYERGTYIYDPTTKGITYELEADSALDMSAYLINNEIVYKVNSYTDSSTENTYLEPVQFTFPNGGDRKWVVQDSKLGSDQQQGKPAVYVMTGRDLSSLGISHPNAGFSRNQDSLYDLNGHKLRYVPSKMIVIKSGKKYLKK